MQHGKVSKGEDGTLYGAKITGGGSGGTVCVIGRNSLRSSQQILEVSCLLQKNNPFRLFRMYMATRTMIFLLVYGDLFQKDNLKISTNIIASLCSVTVRDMVFS